MTGSVLITDGDQRAALACTRALGRAGFSCFVIDPPNGGLAASSRYCRDRAMAPDPQTDPNAFAENVANLSRKWECDFLIPITEKSLRAVLPRSSEFLPTVIPFPSAEVFSRVSDKSKVLGVAKELGILVPDQWEIRSAQDPVIGEIAPSNFPVVTKSTRSVTGSGAEAGRPAVTFSHGPEQLLSHLVTLPATAFPVLVQKRVVGVGAGVFLLLWAGELKAVMGHRRLREKPPSGGVSVVRESTGVDPALLGQAMGLLGSLGWEDGVAMVEFKIEEGSGRCYLMEINGRFWGSLQLAIDAGLDFPTLLLLCAGGTPPTALLTGKPGVRTRWLLGDLDQLLLRIVRNRALLDLPESDPGRIRSVFHFLRDFRPGVRNEVFRLSDPFPFVYEVRGWLRSLLNLG